MAKIIQFSDQNLRRRLGPLRFAQAVALTAALCTTATLRAQTAAPTRSASWQSCAALHNDPNGRLACFDAWARQQAGAGAAAPPAPTQPREEPVTLARTAAASELASPATPHASEGCRNRSYSQLSRFWELEVGSSCDTFGIRGYRPISLSVIGANNVNTQPSSGNPANNAASALPYETTETRIQLSVRTKIAEGLLTPQQPTARDSLWFGYTQQSYWQLFNGTLSRPFRVTDHEPELVYIYPTDARLPGGWRLRYSGIGVVHQSNGQVLPLSRSWNRVYLTGGMERGADFRVQARAWARLPENRASDDNPGISNYVGRAELAGFWNPNRDNTLALTLRHALRTNANGSLRLEWLRTLGLSKGAAATSGLRFHTQLFSGYGDSLLDYNHRRTVLSIGLSLVDF